LQAAIGIAGAHKILFGSDAPAMHPAVELAKIDALTLSDDERRMILYENAHRALRL